MNRRRSRFVSAIDECGKRPASAAGVLRVGNARFEEAAPCPEMRGEPVADRGDLIGDFEDYAVALVDELEKPAHERARFTIGY